MKIFQSPILPVLASGLLMAGPVRSAGAQSGQRFRGNGLSSSIDTTFAFDKNGSITINAGGGDVVVTGWSSDQVHVRAVSDDDDIRLNSSPSRLEVTSIKRTSDTRFELSVPYGARVSANTWSGDITVHGTRGEVETRSQSGDIDVEDVATRLDVNTLSGNLTASKVSGDAEVESVNGDVTLSDVRGNVDVSTVSGDIELRGMTTKVARARTTSGDVTYDGIIDPAGRYEMTTHSGDVRLQIPRDAGAELTVSTWSGSVDSDFPITLEPGEHGIGISASKNFTFQIGNGAARISAETFSGDITISSSGHGASERR